MVAISLIVAAAMLPAATPAALPAQAGTAPPAQQAAPAARAAGISPAVDHHLHLLSPEIAAVINGRPLPTIQVPPPIAQLLRDRASAYNDVAALQRLYSDDAIVLVQTPQKSALYRGSAVAARHFVSRLRNAYRLEPVSFHGDERVAILAGNYTTGEGAQRQQVGTFQLGLVRGADGNWRIASEAPALVNGTPQAPVTAANAVAMLDAAGIRRAVVLSNAGAFGGRFFDVAGQGETSAQRYERVRAENDWAMQQTSQFPDRLISFCSLNPLEPYALDELRRCARTGHRGLKMQFTESFVDLQDAQHVRRVREVFALANTLRLPILVHVGNNSGPEATVVANTRTFLDTVAAAAPRVTIQVAHLWGGGGYSGAALQAYADAVAARHPSTRNMYFDMAEAPMIAARMGPRKQEVMAQIVSAMRRIGLDRILFGSDEFGRSHHQPREAWQMFRDEVPLTEEEFRVVAANVAPYLR